MEFDKTRSCKGCPDRQPFPNCHGTCKEYIERVAKEQEDKLKAKQHIYGNEADMYIKEKAAKQEHQRKRKRWKR